MGDNKEVSYANMAAVNIKLNPVGVGLIALTSVSIVVYMVGLPSFIMGGNSEINMRELLSVSIDLAQVSFFDLFVLSSIDHVEHVNIATSPALVTCLI